MTATLTSQTRLAIAVDGTAIGSFSTMYDVESCSVHKQSTLSDATGIRGTRSHFSERVRETQEIVQGDIVFNGISPVDLDTLLPFVLGADESTDTFALGETLDNHEFAVLVDAGPKRFLYDDCKCSRATFASTQGGFLKLTLGVMGKTETVSDTAFPAIVPSVAANSSPYVHAE